MKKPLKHSLREYFGDISLPADKLQELSARSRESVFSSRPWRGLANPVKTTATTTRKLAIAGASLCILAGLLLFSYRYSTPSQVKRISLSEIASEAAYHHNKRMTSEVSFSSLEELRAFFSKLDFTLIQSIRLPSEKFELLGGRYCSVKGVIAAQLKVKDKNSGNIYTYYQAAWPSDLADIDVPQEFYDAGVRVELWKERGLLLILAHDG